MSYKTTAPALKRPVSNFQEIGINTKLCTNTSKNNAHKKRKIYKFLNSHSLIYNLKFHTHTHCDTRFPSWQKYTLKNVSSFVRTGLLAYLCSLEGKPKIHISMKFNFQHLTGKSRLTFMCRKLKEINKLLFQDQLSN